MKAEQVKGALEKAAGKTQDFLGELTGDERLQMEGKARQSAGELQQRYGDVLDTCATYLQRRPRATLFTVFTVAGLTLTVAWLIKRRNR
ncbi:Uncharacterized conserved protein YjbJ, UPF0337 family [Pseudomonas sp. NFACC02]|uniref:CsbD family protein n=1 Tax=Pseudomonas sp. NFACC02 TaxID=1566250 RepID=UPI0008D82444|nr:CsbD family protein [Pseudomonas sp. NFACC02]SEP98267.1 Uncharacterized conserved protein YjbJ, UPF0337 family [Pseudomonas sp. NFACC02]